MKHQFIIEESFHKRNWITAVDYSKNQRGQPNTFIQFKKEIEARYVRYKHVFCSNICLAISEFTVFGIGSGEKPSKLENFSVKREKDRRNASLRT